MNWSYPTTVTSATSDYVAWTTGNLAGVDFDQVQTVDPLISVCVNVSGSTSSWDNNPATPTEIQDQMKITRSAPLLVTGFNHSVTGTIKGIELEIVGQRYNRIIDWDIRLWNGAKLGNNKKIKIERNDRDQPNNIPNTQLYGSSTDLWGAELTATIINDPGFGVSIEMASHPITPHRDTVYIDSVRMRVFT